MRRLACMLTGTLLCGTAGLLGWQAAKGQQTAAQAKPSSGTATAQKGAASASPYERVLLRPAMLTTKAPETYEVRFITTRGDFTIKVTREWSPLGADRFYNLVRHHYYDNASFFRVLKGFVVQWGISAYPPVTAAWEHAPIKDDPVKQSNLRGYVTFATSGPNTRTAQVFINLGDNQRLDGMGFAPFGQVTDGMDVVDALYSNYGEGAPDGHGPAQDQIEKSGKTYLDKDFPNLDSVKTTKLTAPEGPAPAKKPATAAKPSAPSGK